MKLSKTPTIQAIRECSAGNTPHLYCKKVTALSPALAEAQKALSKQNQLVTTLNQEVKTSSNALSSYKHSSWQGRVTLVLEALPFTSKLLPILEKNFSSFQTFNKGLRILENQLKIDIAAQAKGKICEDQLNKDCLALNELLTQTKEKLNKAQKDFKVKSSNDLMVEVAGGKEAGRFNKKDLIK
jgi:hypothetical protein